MARIGGCVVVYRADIVEVCHSRGGSTVLHDLHEECSTFGTEITMDTNGCYRTTIQESQWIRMDVVWIYNWDYNGYKWVLYVETK
jgi:hypothetical protein